MTKTLDKDIIPVSQLLALDDLAIPKYQRPYKWTLKNVNQLFNDLKVHQHQGTYRLGTIVFHQDNQPLNIVDGQQRTLTLMLAAHAIIEHCLSDIESRPLIKQLNELHNKINHFIDHQTFTNSDSQNNLHQNYLELTRLVKRQDFTEAHIDFLLNHCEVVTFTLTNISEAFQFFDSQNARGRDLDPHDLLKAYHLREFNQQEQHLKADTVAHWESLKSKELTTLFATYLFRIRQWACGYSANEFGKDQVSVFKGVNLDNIDFYPYVEQLRIAHYFIDNYNQQYQRKIDNQQRNFPFSIDQTIINGRRFFEMISHYQQQIGNIIDNEDNVINQLFDHPLSENAKAIFSTLNSYNNRHRSGDQYVRSLFDCAVIFYHDKFGAVELSLAIEKLFIWAYTLRITYQVVQFPSIDKYVSNHNVFRLIKQAITPIEVLSLSLITLNDSNNKNNRRKQDAAEDPLVKLFKQMNYYESQSK